MAAIASHPRLVELMTADITTALAKSRPRRVAPADCLSPLQGIDAPSDRYLERVTRQLSAMPLPASQRSRS